MTLLPSQNRTTMRLPFLSPIRAPGELWSTPGTFTRTSSIVRGSRERTATCRRHCPRASWSPDWRQCMPVRRSSARFRRARSAVGLDWPGRGEGLSDRESEILALITQGKSNAEVAAQTYLSPNTVKSYIRTIYRKIEVGSRTQAVLWDVTMDSPQTISN